MNMTSRVLGLAGAVIAGPSFVLNTMVHNGVMPGPDEVDRQEAVFQIRAHYLHPIRQHESALELARGDPAVEVLTGLIVLLPAADHQLAFLDTHIELIAGETGNSKRDTQPLWVFPIARQPLDIVGRVAVGPLGNTIGDALGLIETKEERAGEGRNS